MSLREFDIFETFPDGSSLWRLCVAGEFNAQRALQDLSERSQHECFAIDITAGERLIPAHLLRRSHSRQKADTVKHTA